MMNENSRVNEINSEISGLKQLLMMSDYKALKYSEGAISELEYAATKVYREDLRSKINVLETELATINE